MWWHGSVTECIHASVVGIIGLQETPLLRSITDNGPVNSLKP